MLQCRVPLKPFDNVNHRKLFCKLNVPLLLYVFYTIGIAPTHLPSEWVRVFQVFLLFQNGVRQGGILSPFLFDVYMGDLSVNLNKLQIGCLYAGILINHLM